MSKEDFIYDDEAVEKEKNKRRRGGVNLVDIDADKCYMLILPPAKDFKHRAPFFETTVYKTKINGKFYEATSPEMEGEEDPIKDMSFRLYNFYKNSKNEKKKKAWQDFKANDERYVNVVKLKKVKNKKTGKSKLVYLESGPCRLPKAAFDLLTSEIDECSVKEVCGPDTGRVMMISDNGKKGLNRRYETVKFLKNPAKLLEKGIIDMEEVRDNMVDLITIPKPYNVADVESLFKALKKQHKKLIDVMIKEEGDDDIDEGEVEEEEVDGIDEDDLELDDMDSSDDELDEDEVSDDDLEIDDDEFEVD